MSQPSHNRSMPPDPHPHLAETCDQADAKAVELVRILDQHLAELKAGQAPSRTELVARHPELATQLEACLAGLEFIHGAESAPGRAQRLGDFRILREVGRGGMGAVFEAEQISLSRRVALKILRFGGVSDPEAIERFKREAETVAKLHHTNIVPIFAVGSERGVNYYAMQFIDGQSLAEVLAESKLPPPPQQVAEWGLQAAEALTHAHQRGVIHRDVKPSNLLLDREQRLWLTDFGLARRMDDVTLSLTGALLGTPRYMSPEQAVASKKRVDHRTDLFSLGATLYELLTGKPAFSGETPHDVIQQILTGEPIGILQIQPRVPRDLETIVMKCLAKEPQRRYSDARELADDLRAFLDGRPIRARRTSLVELAARWFKSQQRSAKLMATAAVVTLAVTLLAIFSRSGYDAWRQGSVKLGSASQPLVAEIMDQQGNVLRRETLPMQEAVQLPAGEYQVRASAEGSLSQTFDISFVRANNLEYSIDLAAERLSSIDVSRTFAFSDLGEKRRSIVHVGNDGIAPFGWKPPQANKDAPAVKSSPGFRWPWSDGSEQYSGFGVYDLRPWIAPQGSDLNGDGRLDLVRAGRHQAWLMAISGHDGSVLWFAGRGQDLKSPPDPNRPYYQRGSVSSTVVGEPIFSHDCNQDGVKDVIATFCDVGADPVRLAGDQVAARCWVESVSGKTGETIWLYEIPPQWLELPAGDLVPYECRWFVGADGGTSSQGRGMMTYGRHVHRQPGKIERTGPHAYRPDAARFVLLGDRSPLGVVAGTHVALLDSLTGQAVQPPLDFQVRPGRSPQWADVDGDGAMDLIIPGERAAQGAMALPKSRISVWSLAKAEEIWSRDLDANWPFRQLWTVDPPQWPLAADLNGDGQSELVVPIATSDSRGFLDTGAETPWGALSVLAGATGKQLWQRRLATMDRQIDHMAAGPDIDGDGWREVYAATLSGSDYRIFVDCLSGKSGEILWTSSSSPLGDDDGYLATLRWWNASEDGWPQLIVEAVDDAHGRRRSLACTFSAGTGKLTHLGRGITAIDPQDIDGDGIEDLVLFSASSGRLDFGGSVEVIRGKSAEPWRRIGHVGDPAADFDGDGVIDLVRSLADGTVRTHSGRTGKPVWETHLVPATRSAQTMRAGADLDGDGIEDLLAWTDTYGPRQLSRPFFAMSGKTGKKLWNAQQVDAQIVNAVLAAQAVDLDRDGKPEVIWMVASDHNYPANRQSWSSHDVQLWLFVVSGQSGALRWKQPLSRAYGEGPGDVLQLSTTGYRLTLAFGDVDGDGTADVLTPGIKSQGPLRSAMETRVLCGKSGRLLWSRHSPMDAARQESLEYWVPPLVCDLDGDGRNDVALVEPAADLSTGSPGPATFHIHAVHGQDGSSRWTWNSQVRGGYMNSIPGQSRGGIMRPVVLRTGENRLRIGALLPGSEGKAVVLDADGTPHERLVGHQSYLSGLVACDVNGDGIDEAVFLDKSLLVVAPSDRLDSPLWTYDSKSAGQGRILGIVTSEQGKPPTIAHVADAIDNTVSGFDAASGDLVWSCPGPIPRSDDGTSYLLANQLALLGSGKGELPFVFCAYASVACCRQATYSTPSGREVDLLAIPPTARGINAAPAVLQVAGRDPRWQRNLPWVEQHISWRQGLSFIAWGLFFSTLLVVVPAGYLVRLVWLRRFGLKTLLVMPIVAGIFLTAAFVQAPADNDFNSLRGRLLIGAVFAPAVVGMGLLAWWLVRGQWRRTALWLTITILASAACGAVAIWQAGEWKPLLPEESYDLTGWYMIWFAGAYLTSWLALIVLPTKHALLSLWQWWQRRTALSAPASGVSAVHVQPGDPTQPVARRSPV